MSLGSSESLEVGEWCDGEGVGFMTFQTSQRPSWRFGWWTGDPTEPRLVIWGGNCILLSTRMKIKYMDSKHPWKRSASCSPNHFPLSPTHAVSYLFQPSLQIAVVR